MYHLYAKKEGIFFWGLFLKQNRLTLHRYTGSNCNVTYYGKASLREKCPYSELFWSVFSCIRTEYGKIFRVLFH